jgi:hypothetical protein
LSFSNRRFSRSLRSQIRYDARTAATVADRKGRDILEDRRRAERLPITIPIELRNGTGITRDVSGLGVFFSGPYPFEKDEEIEFLLRVPGSIDVQCSGKVVRSEFDRESMSYGVAVTIEKFDLPEALPETSHESHIVLSELRKHHANR